MRRIVLGCIILGLGAGCAAKRVETTSQEARPAPREQEVKVTPVRAERPTDTPEEKALPRFSGTTLHFEFDESSLSDGATAELRELAETMRADGKLRVNIAGHCDERGTTEYNLALGQKRAEIAKQYLVTLGVDAQRISTLTYGEEMPAQSGEDEDAWAANRRDEIAPQ